MLEADLGSDKIRASWHRVTIQVVTYFKSYSSCLRASQLRNKGTLQSLQVEPFEARLLARWYGTAVNGAVET